MNILHLIDAKKMFFSKKFNTTFFLLLFIKEEIFKLPSERKTEFRSLILTRLRLTSDLLPVSE